MSEDNKTTVIINEEVGRQLVKQLKRLNFWITTFGVFFLLVLGVVIFLLVQVFLFMKDTGDRLQPFQDSTASKLDVKTQVCEGTDGFSAWLKSNTSACE